MNEIAMLTATGRVNNRLQVVYKNVTSCLQICHTDFTRMSLRCHHLRVYLREKQGR
jgi:hypothetical protein